jgi:hypothetical protein
LARAKNRRVSINKLTRTKKQEVIMKLNKSKLAKLVDDAGDFDQLIKSSSSELDYLKGVLKSHAKDNSERILEGDKFIGKIGTTTTTHVNLSDIFFLLADGDIATFLNLVKPDVKAIRERCDAVGLSTGKFIRNRKNMFGSISFKEKPKRVRRRNAK